MDNVRTSRIIETKEISENIYVDIDGKGNIVSMTIEHAKDNAGLWNSHTRKCLVKQHRDAELFSEPDLHFPPLHAGMSEIH